MVTLEVLGAKQVRVRALLEVGRAQCALELGAVEVLGGVAGVREHGLGVGLAVLWCLAWREIQESIMTEPV